MISAIFTAITLIFSWEAPTDGSQVDGYKIVYGEESGQFVNSRNVGNVTRFQWEDYPLSSGRFVAVKAYNRFGDSDPSEELNLSHPTPPGTFRVE